MSKKRDQREETVHPDTAEARRIVASAAEPAAPAVSPEPEAVSPTAAPADPEKRLQALEAEVADLRERLLRKQADFENFRKRMLREREEASRYANATLLGDLAAVIDDFERAIRSAEESKDFPVFLQGVGMIERRMLEMLENRWGLKRFSAVGEAFDPVRHEAMQRAEAPAGSPPTGPVVVEEYQKGYYLHDRVLRPAKVKVQVPAEPRSPAPPTVEDEPGDGHE